ncbi:Uncharacterized protein APZ42_006434, partial [Daphnia magna]
SSLPAPSSAPSVIFAPSSSPVVTSAPSSAPSVIFAPSSSPVVTSSPSSAPSVIFAPSSPPVVTSTPSSAPSVISSPSSSPVVFFAPSDVAAPFAKSTPFIISAPSTVSKRPLGPSPLNINSISEEERARRFVANYKDREKQNKIREAAMEERRQREAKEKENRTEENQIGGRKGGRRKRQVRLPSKAECFAPLRRVREETVVEREERRARERWETLSVSEICNKEAEEKEPRKAKTKAEEEELRKTKVESIEEREARRKKEQLERSRINEAAKNEQEEDKKLERIRMEITSSNKTNPKNFTCLTFINKDIITSPNKMEMDQDALAEALVNLAANQQLQQQQFQIQQQQMRQQQDVLTALANRLLAAPVVAAPVNPVPAPAVAIRTTLDSDVKYSGSKDESLQDWL